MSVPEKPPKVKVRFVLPHDFLLQSCEIITNRNGVATELVIIPYVADDLSVGLAGHLIAELENEEGTIIPLSVLDLKISLNKGLRLCQPPGRVPQARPAYRRFIEDKRAREGLKTLQAKKPQFEDGDEEVREDS